MMLGFYFNPLTTDIYSRGILGAELGALDASVLSEASEGVRPSSNEAEK